MRSIVIKMNDLKNNFMIAAAHSYAARIFMAGAVAWSHALKVSIVMAWHRQNVSALFHRNLDDSFEITVDAFSAKRRARCALLLCQENIDMMKRCAAHGR